MSKLEVLEKTKPLILTYTTNQEGQRDGQNS